MYSWPKAMVERFHRKSFIQFVQWIKKGKWKSKSTLKYSYMTFGREINLNGFDLYYKILCILLEPLWGILKMTRLSYLKYLIRLNYYLRQNSRSSKEPLDPNSIAVFLILLIWEAWLYLKFEISFIFSDSPSCAWETLIWEQVQSLSVLWN